jgi:maleylpyruvate isomerase
MDAGPVQPPEAWIDLASSQHDLLLLELERNLDVTAPSLLPGWTVGHVITHVTNSGDGHLRMLDAAAEGTVGRQYPGGIEQRAEDIEAGARRPAVEQIADLRRSIVALERRWHSMPSWQGFGATPRGGDVPIADLPYLRIREVAIHHVDLGIGYVVDDLPDAYVDEELRRMSAMWLAKWDPTASALPDAALAAPAPERLAWLLGRTSIDGLDRAGIY